MLIGYGIMAPFTAERPNARTRNGSRPTRLPIINAGTVFNAILARRYLEAERRHYQITAAAAEYHGAPEDTEVVDFIVKYRTYRQVQDVALSEGLILNDVQPRHDSNEKVDTGAWNQFLYQYWGRLCGRKGEQLIRR